MKTPPPATQRAVRRLVWRARRLAARPWKRRLLWRRSCLAPPFPEGSSNRETEKQKLDGTGYCQQYSLLLPGIESQPQHKAVDESIESGYRYQPGRSLRPLGKTPEQKHGGNAEPASKDHGPNCSTLVNHVLQDFPAAA